MPTEIIPLLTLRPVLFGVLKVTWRDGYEAIVDLRPVLDQGEIFAFLREDHARFDGAELDEHGHTVFWLDPEGDTIDLGTDSLRRRAERQAELLRLAS